MSEDLSLAIESAMADKSARRESDDAMSWAAQRVQSRQQQAAAEEPQKSPSAESGQSDAQGSRESQMAAYEAARANFEAARGDIEAGKLQAYPTWQDAEAALERLHPDNQEKWWAKVVRNASPLEFAGGALDYADNAFETIRMISERGDRAIMEMGIPAATYTPGEGFGLTTDPEEFAKTKNVGDALPDIGDPEKMGIARAMGRFMAGYATAGRALSGVQTLRTLAESGQVGQSAVAALKGAMSDFSGVRELEGNLADLSAAFPEFGKLVPEFMKTDEDDPALINKMRTALIGAGFGMAFDGLMAGLRAVRARRAIAPVVDDVARQAQGMINEAETSRMMIRETLGDPDDARLLIEAGEVAGESGAEAGAAAGARAASDGATNPRINTGGKIGDVYVNWARIDSDDDVKRIIQDLADRYSDSIDAARGPVETFGETIDAAAQEDAWKILTERAQGTTLNARQTFAVRQLWTSSGRAVRDLSQRVAVGGSVADQVALKKMISVHAAIQEQVIGIRTETARALSQWRIPAGESDQFFMGLEHLRSQMGAEQDVLKIAKAINDLADTGRADALDAFVSGASKLDELKRLGMNTSDAIRQLWYLSILSGPQTHTRNMSSNLGMLLLDSASTRGAAMLGKALGGQNVPDGEALAKVYGQIEGIRDAFRISSIAREAAESAGQEATSPVMNALKTGQTGLGVGKIDMPSVGALSADKWRVDPTTNLGRVLDFIDTASQYNTRLMAAEDEVFRTAGMQGEIHALAFRQATNEAASGMIEQSAVIGRAAELARTPSTAMRLLAQNHAARLVMQAPPAPGSPLMGALRGIGKIPVLGRLTMPFQRTAYNIAIESAQLSPLAPLTKRFMDQIRAGGAQGDIAWTKFLAGNAALVALADLAIKGHLTGASEGLGSSDVSRGESETKRLAGQAPQSVSVEREDGSTVNVSYRGLEPLSTSLGIASNVVEILMSDQFEDDEKEGEALVIAASAAIATQITAPSFMTGLADSIMLMDDPQRGAQRYLNRTVSSVVPNAVFAVTKTQDPIVREVNGMIDAIKAKTPGLSKTLPAARDRWGRERRRDSGIGWAYDMVSPLAVKVVRPEPIDKELERLDVGLAGPDRTITIDGVSLNMRNHPHEFSKYVQMQGDGIRETVEGDPIFIRSIGYESEGGTLVEELNAIVKGEHAFSEIYHDPEASDGPDGDKAAFIESIVNAFRKEAKAHLLVEYPALLEKVRIKKDAIAPRGFGPQGQVGLIDRLE